MNRRNLLAGIIAAIPGMFLIPSKKENEAEPHIIYMVEHSGHDNVWEYYGYFNTLVGHEYKEWLLVYDDSGNINFSAE